MIGDRILIGQIHTERAADLCGILKERLRDKFVIAVAGESGAGKSALAVALARRRTNQGFKTGILQQDDYYVFPPKTNHEMRRRNLEQVGPYEVKLDFLDCNLRSFKRDENPIYKPLVIYEEDRITTEELDTGDWWALIVEGTYTSLLKFADFRVFIDRDFRQTLEARRRRARDRWEPFLEDVLEREHRILAEHKALADAVIPADYGSIQLREK
jgi:uridine kinase